MREVFYFCLNLGFVKRRSSALKFGSALNAQGEKSAKVMPAANLGIMDAGCGSMSCNK